MVEVVRSDVFDAWLKGIRDRVVRAKVLVRIERLAAGDPGDIKPIGAGLSEMRIDHGPGYRLYLMQQGTDIVVLLAGGDKRTQAVDIGRAKALAEAWKRGR